MIAKSIIIFGSVQGVNYRYYTKKTADSLGLKGYVKNNPDGSVNVLAIGKETSVNELIEWCKKGPKFANVKELKEKEVEIDNHINDFRIN